MFGPLGAPEIIFIVVLALLIFGPRRLPEVGRTVGKALGEFRRATTELKRSVNTELALEDERPVPRRPGGSTTPALAAGPAVRPDPNAQPRGAEPPPSAQHRVADLLEARKAGQRPADEAPAWAPEPSERELPAPPAMADDPEPPAERETTRNPPPRDRDPGTA